MKTYLKDKLQALIDAPCVVRRLKPWITYLWIALLPKMFGLSLSSQPQHFCTFSNHYNESIFYLEGKVSPHADK